MQQGSSNTKVQFVLRYTKGGASNTESLINHLKSTHGIRVIHESEDHKIIVVFTLMDNTDPIKN